MRTIVSWFDAWAGSTPADDRIAPRVEWLRILPFLGVHAAVLLVFVVGVSPFALAFAAALYVVRMFGLTAGYHRYFSHRAYKTSRPMQFLLALLGTTAVQRGPLWWSAHHREHHRVSDQPEDPHSPRQHGFLWSHVGWFTSRANLRTRIERVPDWARYPELVFLDRFTLLPVVLFAAAIYGLGVVLERAAPGLGTNGPQLFVWGFIVSTVVLYHGTFTINSLAHKIGRRRYPTDDDSRNHLGLALLTLGEGWHNNHHHYPASARQGFHWWQVDLSYYALRGLAALRLVWDLKGVPLHVRDAPGMSPDRDARFVVEGGGAASAARPGVPRPEGVGLPTTSQGRA